MQARPYLPEVGRFLTEDRYESAAGDLNLEADPLTQDRYAFAGGNPVNNIESDGHCFFSGNAIGSPYCGNTFDNRPASKKQRRQARHPKANRPNYGVSPSPGWNQYRRTVTPAKSSPTQGGGGSSGQNTQPAPAKPTAPPGAKGSGCGVFGPACDAAGKGFNYLKCSSQASSFPGVNGPGCDGATPSNAKVNSAITEGLDQAANISMSLGPQGGPELRAFFGGLSQLSRLGAPIGRGAQSTGGLGRLADETGSIGGNSATKAGRGLTDGERVGIVRDAFQRKGNYGLGQAGRSEADELGMDFVGSGFTKSKRDPRILVSQDGLRQYRPPSYKPNMGRTQANFERRFEPGGRFNANGHLDVVP